MGSFANGCIIGAQQLPLNSNDYQVMRIDPHRYFGHPDLLAFIHRFSRKAHQKALGMGVDRRYGDASRLAFQ